jgi:hypothetical protein
VVPPEYSSETVTVKPVEYVTIEVNAYFFRKIILKRKYTNTYHLFAAHFERLEQ